MCQCENWQSMVSSLQNNQVDLGTDVRLYEAFNALAGQFTSSLTFFAPTMARRTTEKKSPWWKTWFAWLQAWLAWFYELIPALAKHVFLLSILLNVCYWPFTDLYSFRPSAPLPARLLGVNVCVPGNDACGLAQRVELQWFFTSHIQIISNLLSAKSKVWKEFWTPVLHFLPSPEAFEVFVSCNLQELNLRSRI